MVKKYTDQEIFDLPMFEDNEADAKTIGDYFNRITLKVWIEEEGFDGKRPFGNSGWQRDIKKALIEAEAIKGSLDRDGYIENVDSEAAQKMIEKALKSRIQE